MGGRHNIGIIQYPYGYDHSQEIMWLYAHSGFWSDVPGVEGFAACLALALDEARPRWDDEIYFNRIIILSLGDSIRGISLGSAIGDEHKRFLVDPRTHKVLLMENHPWNGEYRSMPDPIASWSFECFIEKFGKHEKTVRNEY